MPEEIIEPTVPEFPFPWMPLTVGEIEVVNWDGYSYVDRSGRTYWSGVEPSESDAADAVSVPRSKPSPVPLEVSPWQIRRALNAVGLRASVEAAVASANQDTRDGWIFATVIRRDNPLLAALAAEMEIEPAQLDELFQLAATFE